MTRPLTAVVLAFAGLVALLAVPLPGAKHETWFEARSPNFIVVCNAGEKQARKTAIRFEQIRAVFRRELEFASKYESPVITILAVKDEDSVKALLPEYWVKGHAHPGGDVSGQHEFVFCGGAARCSGSESLQHHLS